jgi:multiple sugar transport system ATP-binding protein
MASLKIRNLKKSFAGNTVIDSISFDVPKGEFCILLGPSGCGKTTVLRLIAGLERKDEGEVYIADREVSDLTPRERDIAMVFQSYALYPHLSVYENMAFSLMMRKRRKHEIDKKVTEAAKLLGIEDFFDRKPKELSGGQRQRVAIGRAIVRNPKLFLFDEPLSNLDAKLRSSMRVEIAKLHQKLQATMIYVTHDQVEAMTLGEKIVLLDKGEIQQIGSPEEVYKRPSNLFVATFIGSPRINLINGTVIADRGKVLIKSGNIVFGHGLMEELRQYTGREITVGLRPESLTPGDGPFKGEVDLVENLGSETLVHIRINDSRLIAKVHTETQTKMGEHISLSLRDTGIHFFYDGKRINLP